MVMYHLPLQKLSDKDNFIWYHKNGKKEVYLVSDDPKEIEKEVQDYIIQESIKCGDYNKIIFDKSRVNDSFLDDIIVNFHTSNLVTLFNPELEYNDLHNKMNTTFILTNKVNKEYISSFYDLFFYKILLDTPINDNVIRLVSISSSATFPLADMLKDPKKDRVSYAYCNENKLFPNELNNGRAFITNFKNVLFTGNGLECFMYFPHTMNVLDIILEDDFSDYLNTNPISIGGLNTNVYNL